MLVLGNKAAHGHLQEHSGNNHIHEVIEKIKGPLVLQ